MTVSPARLSLRVQLMLWYTAAIIALFAVLFLTLNQFLWSRLEGELDDSLVTQALAMDNRAKGLGVTTLEQYGETFLGGHSELVTSTGYRSLYYRLVSPTGKVVLTVPGSFSDAPSLPKEFSPEAGGGFQDIQVPRAGKTRLYSRSLFSSSGEFLGYLEIAERYENIYDPLEKLGSTLLWQSLAGVFLALGIGYAIAWRALKPLDKMVALADDINEKNLLVRLPDEPRPHEIQRLADSFNDLLERVGNAFEQQRLFSADVSHELRSPLAALRTQLEVLQMDPDLPSQLRLRLVELEAEAVRLIQLASNLLLMAQLEAGNSIESDAVDLVDLLHEVYREAQLLADGRRIVITREAPCVVEGDRSLLKQIFLNLVSNAIKYTNEGGRVELSVQVADQMAKVVVSDNGIGIPASAKSRLFEPFFRADPSRTRTAGGAGLGLAITKRILDRHHGKAIVDSVEGAGTTFTVHLPLAGAPGGPGAQTASAHGLTAA